MWVLRAYTVKVIAGHIYVLQSWQAMAPLWRQTPLKAAVVQVQGIQQLHAAAILTPSRGQRSTEVIIEGHVELGELWESDKVSPARRQRPLQHRAQLIIK